MGTLFIVPTPIGNLEDITLRALRILKEVSLIAAEDTRTSKILLKHYEILTPLTSYHEHNKMSKLDIIFDSLVSGDVALISDAGTPAISDPGYELVKRAVDEGYRIEPLPGANAVLPALVASGLPTDSFIYIGFLPKKAMARQAILQSLSDEARTIIAYESPNRLTDTLTAIVDTLGDRSVCVAREISKYYEEFQRGLASEVHGYYVEHRPRGEITLVIGGKVEDTTAWDEDRVQKALYERLDSGESLSFASKAIAKESGWNKRDVYALGLNE